jgi:hypothetical protein
MSTVRDVMIMLDLGLNTVVLGLMTIATLLVGVLGGRK